LETKAPPLLTNDAARTDHTPSLGNQAIQRLALAGDSRALQALRPPAGGNLAIQRYVVKQALAVNGQQFEAQELQQNGSFAGTHHPNAAPPLRVSEDGRMAIEDSDLTQRQPKVFYAEPAIVKASNQILIEVGSKYILYIDQSDAITVDNSNRQPHLLDRILPRKVDSAGPSKHFWENEPKYLKRKQAYLESTNTNSEGLTMEVEQTCVDVAEAIINGQTQYMFPKLGQSLQRGGTSMYDYQVAVYLTKRLRGQNHRNADAAAANVQVKGDDANQITRDLMRWMGKKPNRARRLFRELGVNEAADPQIGQAFQIIGLGGTVQGAPIPDYVADRTGQTTVYPTVRQGNKISRNHWGDHVGAVIAESAGNKVTLENYARSHELGTLRTGPDYYFQMYGPKTIPNQTWHHVWSHAASRVVNPLTLVYGK
jgi:hypothetical protein